MLVILYLGQQKGRSFLLMIRREILKQQLPGN